MNDKTTTSDVVTFPKFKETLMANYDGPKHAYIFLTEFEYIVFNGLGQVKFAHGGSI